MFDSIFIKKAKYFLFFIIIYTVFFFLFFSTLSYTLPFVIALIIAIITRPLTKFLRMKFKLSRGVSSLIATLVVFLLLFIILSMIVLKITTEAGQLINSSPNLDNYRTFIESNLEKLKAYYNQIDPQIVDKVKEQLTSLISNFYDVAVDLIKSLFSFAIGLPVLIMIIFITLIATYFFSRDILDLEKNLLSMFSSSGRQKVISVWQEGAVMLGNYLKSYSIIICLTFIETLVAFSIIGVKYSLILSIVSAVFDILPVLGISAVYLPLAAVYFLTGNTTIGFFIIGVFILISIIRQVLEPKLVSSSLGLHPLAVLAAIYIGLKAYGFTGMFYLLFLMVFYNILRKVKIL